MSGKTLLLYGYPPEISNRLKMKLSYLSMILFISIASFGQKVTYNHVVDPSREETKQIMALFEQYINAKPEERKAYWNTVEKEKHKDYDFLESEFQPSLYMGFPVHVLSLKSSSGQYQIKAQFSYYKEDGSPYVLAIANYYAKRENGKFKLYNALTHNRQNWNCSNVGWVDFYYPKDHTFDLEKADALNEFIERTCRTFGVYPKPFEYYLADDYDEIQKLKGIDYYMGMGGESVPKGKASGNKVYCGGLGEYYPHEVFHVQIDAHYPDKHFWVSEGLATFLAGSRGKSLQWHIKRTNNHLKENPRINLNDMLELDNLDPLTAYHYVLGGLIAKRIFEKGGWELIKKFMASGKTDMDYYIAIEKYLGIGKPELNVYLRKELERESKL